MSGLRKEGEAALLPLALGSCTGVRVHRVGRDAYCNSYSFMLQCLVQSADLAIGFLVSVGHLALTCVNTSCANFSCSGRGSGLASQVHYRLVAVGSSTKQESFFVAFLVVCEYMNEEPASPAVA